MRNSKALGLTCSLFFSLNSLAVFATEKEAAQPANKLDSLEKIQIRGIRGSIVKSIETKRYSDAIVDAITAEDIGKFPDKNVAESLQRITGVSLTRVQGEGERGRPLCGK